MKKFLILMSILALLLLGACGGKDKGEAKQTSNEDKGTQAQNKEDDQAKGKDDSKDTSGNKEKSSDEENDGDMLNPYIEEETGGEVEVVFTNKNPGFSHAFSDKVSMTIDEYQIVHVTNMNESAKSTFDDQDEGYVLTLKLMLNNQSEDDVSYAGGLSLLSDDATENIIRRPSLVDREQWLKDESTEDASLYSAGKSFTGMDAFMLTKDQFEKSKLPILKIDALWRGDDVSDRIGEQAVIPLPLSDEGKEKAEKTANLYQDKMVSDTIAEKELFFSKEDINETKEIDKVKVTLNGVQYANITPTEGNKERFTNFGDGTLVALTAKFTIENNSDTAFDQSLIGKKLHVDDRGTMLSQGMLEPTVRGSVEPGDTFEGLAVFLMREDEFSIFKELKLEIGPLADEQAKKLFKEKSVLFDLPMKE
ncbi:DUF5068 domain-containing protein [Lederbergia sp. NSJ-179]|uniref:DUF5068 domain-containing protein n=1 Tax=Lederbergia sp. NSJ-179 TaxID=2931402 RepID=UPI001FD2A0B9|nr:DUF5068 domain-containing protein [Lederbergia sp. NSJ-179]MCJ7840113.1 DUF5068 domain-containing protein [Lederbergia sp. NSJ-179]